MMIDLLQLAILAAARLASDLARAEFDHLGEIALVRALADWNLNQQVAAYAAVRVRS